MGENKNAILALIAVVCVGVAGWRFLSSGKGGGGTLPAKSAAHAMCLACKTESEVTFPSKELPPHKCAACDQQAAYPLWICRECRYRFIPALGKRADGPPRPSPFPSCPHCGCNDVAPWDPEFFNAVADAKWPAWP